MSLHVCAECTTAYAIGLPACPHCLSAEREDDAMPKITKAGGPSHEPAPTTEPAPAPVADPVEAVTEPEPADEAPPKPSPRRRPRKNTDG